MFSNFVETTNIRLNGIYPDKELKTVPLLASRVIEGKKHLDKGGSGYRNFWLKA